MTLIVTFIAPVVFCARFAIGQIDDGQFRSDLRAICAPATRAIGSDGYYSTARWLEAEIAKLPNVDLQVHKYSVVVPVTDRAQLTFADGTTERVHPFWPAGARVCSTPAEGIRGQLVYCADARIHQIPIGKIAGQIAVVEARSENAWTRAISSGASAIIVLGNADATNYDLGYHDIRIPINLPRFYLPDGKRANEIRSKTLDSREVTLRASVRWETRTAINLYALVKPRQPDPKNRPAITIYAPFDSTSVVPDLAPGASQAIQTASALALLRDLSRTPPTDRAALVCFGGADGIQLLGSRHMLLALAESPHTWWNEMSELSLKQNDAYQARYRARELRDRPGALDARRDRALVDRISRLLETDLKLIQDELFRYRAQSIDARELEARQASTNRTLAALQNGPGDLQGDLFDRTIAHLDELLAQYADRKGQIDRRVELYQWLARALGRKTDPEESDSTNRLLEVVIGLDLSDRGTRIGPITEGTFQRATSIADVQDYLAWLNRAARNERAGGSISWFDLIRSRIDLEPPTQPRTTRSYLATGLALSTELTQAWGVPGFGLVTLDDLRLFRDTPNDTLDRIDLDAIRGQLITVRQIIVHAINDPTFTGPTDRKRRRASIPGQVVSLAPGKPIPDLGRRDFFITYHYAGTVVSMYPRLRQMPWTLGVRRNEMIACDAEGNYLIEGLPRLNNDLQLFAITAHRIDPTSGAITATTDLGKQTGDIKIYRDIKNAVTPMQSLVFDCEEIALTDVFDPRFMQPLNELTLLDARREAEPQRFSFYIDDGLFAGFIEPGMKVDLAFRYGRLGNRLLLRQPLGESASAGVSASQQLPLPLRTAQDFWSLNDTRLETYRRAGVTSTVIDTMHRNSATQIDQAKSALAQNHPDAFAKHSELAWSNEARVYDAVRDLADDVVRGAIFLLLLCVPFAFCMERLLIGTANVYRQIIGASIIFIVMLAALWSFHPAFRISASPLIVVLAFAIIVMSVTVIVVIYNKFDVELKRIRADAGHYATGSSGSSGRTATGVSTDDISLARAGVLANAILLGIANMRRRKLRTALTSITIVLITFAVLCFTSTTSYLDTIALPTGASSDGRHELLLRQRGHRPIPNDVADSLLAAIGRDRRIAERWWNVSHNDPKDQIALYTRERIVPLRGLLGISPGESEFTDIAQILGERNFARLQQGERNIIFLPTQIAQQLNVREGDRLRLAGIHVELAGVFDAKQFDDTILSLSGEPIGPLLYTRDALDTGGRKLADTAAAESLELSNTTQAELHPNYEHLPSSEIAIIPASLSRNLPYGNLRAVAVKLDDGKQVRDLSDIVARRFALACFAAGYDDAPDTRDDVPHPRDDARAFSPLPVLGERLGEGSARTRVTAPAASEEPLLKQRPLTRTRTRVQASPSTGRGRETAPASSSDTAVRMVTAGNLRRVSGAGQIAIPLVIAGLIVFNTMMGSIAERRREIHVYTSLGLAPLHVGALFLAEASVYGLIGTVFGYIIGQAFGTALTHLGWLGDVTMNYSGTSAILTMTMMLAITLTSAVIPARIAAKIAAPSIERTWRVPEPVQIASHDTITATLPFTINRATADDALARLTDFFESHTDSSIGHFAAGPVRPIASESARGLATEIWLQPFDLGIRQQLELHIKEGSFPDIFEVELHLSRLSGDERTWHRANRPFLAELRKQFLRWRGQRLHLEGTPAVSSTSVVG